MHKFRGVIWTVVTGVRFVLNVANKSLLPSLFVPPLLALAPPCALTSQHRTVLSSPPLMSMELSALNVKEATGCECPVMDLISRPELRSQRRMDKSRAAQVSGLVSCYEFGDSHALAMNRPSGLIAMQLTASV